MWGMQHAACLELLRKELLIEEMFRSKNIVSVGLMVSSLLVLLLFELFWLRREYQEQRDWLTSTIDYHFQKSVFESQDKILLKWLRKGEQAAEFSINERTDSTDVRIRFSTPSHIKLDVSSKVSASRKDSVKHKQVSFFAATDRDTGNISRKILLDIPDGAAFEQFTMLDLTGDTLSVETLNQDYRNRLDTAGVDLVFELKDLATKEEAGQENGIHTKPVFAGINSGKYYLAVFPNSRWFLLRRIVPQILFSLFLFLLTALAFWIIFRTLRQQRRLIALKNDFISNITHELKTPITTVGVAIEALSNFNALQDPRRTEEYLDISKNELKRLSLLVDKVLRMSLFEKQEPELKLESFDLRELVEEILRTMKLQFDKFAAQVSFQYQDQDFQLRADRLHLTSVIYNLIDNALKYSREQPQIQIGLDRQGNQLALSVRDNGLGIPPEYQKRIFDKFFRVPTGDRHDTKGHGLGLSYIASVVRQHDGQISVESKPGEGSAFTVRLPVKA